jgi:hypothetical protein
MSISHCLQRQASGERSFTSVFEDVDVATLEDVPPTDNDVRDGMGRLLHQGILHRAPTNTTKKFRVSLYASTARAMGDDSADISAGRADKSIDHVHSYPVFQTTRRKDGQKPLTQKAVHKRLHNPFLWNSAPNITALEQFALVRRIFYSAAPLDICAAAVLQYSLFLWHGRLNSQKTGKKSLGG